MTTAEYWDLVSCPLLQYGKMTENPNPKNNIVIIIVVSMYTGSSILS